MKANGDRIFEKICIIWLVVPIGGITASLLVALPLALFLWVMGVESTEAVKQVLFLVQSVAGAAGGVWLAWYLWPRPKEPKSERDGQLNKPLQPTGSADG